MTNHKIVPIDVIILDIEKRKESSNLLYLELPQPNPPNKKESDTHPNLEPVIISIYGEDQPEENGCTIFNLI